MKKETKFLFTFLLLSPLLTLKGQSQKEQSLSDSIQLKEVTISSASTNKVLNMNNASTTLLKKSFGAEKNIPNILQMLPSVVSFSEDGSGIGNTSLRIRGTDATRINVSLNGMPLNNPESQEVYWVNLPNISNSLQSVNVQRGVGSSTVGSSAFGASIAMNTEGGKSSPYGEASTSLGSYNTFVSSIAAGTGLLKNGLSIDGRYSKTTGDGYIRNGKVNHQSGYIALSHYKDSQVIRLSYINGIQHTGITWEGISPEMMKIDRRYNPAGEYKDDAENIHYYDNETDNYYSNIAQLTYSNTISKRLNINASFSYNHGYGYYENYKTDQNLETIYGLKPQIIDNITYSKSDVIVRKLMSNNYYTGNVILNYRINKLSMTSGLFASTFDGDHYGRLKWVKYNADIPKNYEWYNNTSDKKDVSVFIRVNYSITHSFSIFGDVQYRHVNYKMKGIDDDFENITNTQNYNFLNPKLGISYLIGDQQEVYSSLAIANREPLRTDIKESIKGGNRNIIKPERLYDYELGYRYSASKISFNTNIYYMHYKDQMIQTGKLNDVGYKLMENVPHSYRLGIEFIAGYKPISWFRIDANLTLSKNKIKNYTAYYDLYNNQIDWTLVKQKSEYLGNTDISFSPNIVGAASLTFEPFDRLNISLTGKYVGKQYYDNTSNQKNQLPDYLVCGLVAGYTFKATKIGNIDFQISINNLPNKRYVANAWVSTDKFEDGTSVTYKGYFPQATRNLMFKGGITF